MKNKQIIPGSDEKKSTYCTTLIVDKMEIKTKLNKISGLSYSDRRLIDNEFYCYRIHSIKIYKAKSKTYFKHQIALIKTRL